jgi:hypothetical protein
MSCLRVEPFDLRHTPLCFDMLTSCGQLNVSFHHQTRHQRARCCNQSCPDSFASLSTQDAIGRNVPKAQTAYSTVVGVGSEVLGAHHGIAAATCLESSNVSLRHQGAANLQ